MAPPASRMDGSSLRVHRSGLVWAAYFSGPCNKRRTGKAWGGCLHLHSHIPGARRDDRVLLHGQLPDGPEEVYDHPQGLRRFQSDQGDQRCHLEAGPNRWPALQLAGQESDRPVEALPGPISGAERCSMMEMATMLVEVAQVMNILPIARGKTIEGSVQW